MIHMENVRAFTLVETLVTVAVSLFLVVALATVFGSFQSLFGYERVFRTNTDAAGTVMRAAEEAILPAYRVVASRAFASGTYSSDASSLVLQVPSVDASGTVIASTYDYVALYRSGSTAYRLVEIGAGSARRPGSVRLGEDIASLAFSYNNADVAAATIVTVAVVASTTVRGEEVAVRLAERVRLRNF